jgi:hypothetical protein
MDQSPCTEELLEDPATSFWLKTAIRALMDRDPVDALNDSELLRQVMHRRAQACFSAFVTTMLPTDQAADTQDVVDTVQKGCEEMNALRFENKVADRIVAHVNREIHNAVVSSTPVSPRRINQGPLIVVFVLLMTFVIVVIGLMISRSQHQITATSRFRNEPVARPAASEEQFPKAEHLRELSAQELLEFERRP